MVPATGDTKVACKMAMSPPAFERMVEQIRSAKKSSEQCIQLQVKPWSKKKINVDHELIQPQMYVYDGPLQKYIVPDAGYKFHQKS